MASAFAQYDPKDQKDYTYGYDNGRGSRFDDGKYRKDKGDDRFFNDSYYFKAREKDMQIARINREFNFKVFEVKSNFFMGRRKKEYKIQCLEQERQNAIQAVFAKFNEIKYWKEDHDRFSRHNW